MAVSPIEMPVIGCAPVPRIGSHAGRASGRVAATNTAGAIRARVGDQSGRAWVMTRMTGEQC